ncbi:MAG: hypothetical protein EKK63_15790 [Acinetobacter sp.]|uniref:recombination protein NinG n=1 Tax=Acinetobacter sp. TaxID=472 RepID=UPI000FB1C566|nr:recombination protein NinG [Acinetobacter sp.]RUP37030.1 MAG: hypothetical protein EKK63_15790 [Acinetobacter sp.]
MPKCAICKTKFHPQNSSLEKTCQNQECKFDYAMKVVEKNRKEKEKAAKQEWKAQKAVLTESARKKSWYESQLEREVRTIIRLIDKNCPCIACGTYDTIRWDAGHYHSSGGSRYIRYHADNIFISCYTCNCRKGGNQTGMKLNIDRVFGSEYREKVDFYILQTKPLHLSIPELKDKIVIARLLVKEFEAAEKMGVVLPRNAAQRLEMREYVNKRLEIYK